MIKKQQLSRRGLLKGALGTAAISTIGMPSFATTKSKSTILNLDDPAQRVVARAKTIGSIESKLIYTFYRLHLYGYMNDGNLLPFFTMNNLNISRWTPLANGNYQTKGAECGVYCKFDTDEVLEEWLNPITHEKRKIWQFVGGPLSAEIGPDGVVTGGVAELKPESLRMEVMGDKLFVPTQAALSHKSPFEPAKWPKSESGNTRYWDSHFLASANLDQVMDPSVSTAKSFLQFQNLGSWHPWLGMGGHPGRTYGKAYGVKLDSLDELPPGVLKGIEAKTPEIFDFESWEKPKIDFLDYMATHEPE